MILITAKGRQCHFDVDFFGVYLLYATYNISYHKHFDNGSSGETVLRADLTLDSLHSSLEALSPYPHTEMHFNIVLSILINLPSCVDKFEL